MANEAAFSVTGYIATQPVAGFTRKGTATLSMRIGWTPRRIDKDTGDWADEPTSFATVKCYNKVALNAAACLRKGDPIVLKGHLRIREYVDQAGLKRTVVEIFADSIGHDLSRGVSLFTKAQAQLAKTALENLAAEVAAGRATLPGDRPIVDEPGDSSASDRVKPDELAERTGEGEPGGTDEGYDGDERDGADEDEDEDGMFDEEEAKEILSAAPDSAAVPI